MAELSLFQELMQKFADEIPGIGKYVHTDLETFLWYEACNSYGNGKNRHLHFEILDGSPYQNRRRLSMLYEAGVAYVELHFEAWGPKDRKQYADVIGFFASKLKVLDGPYQFIPEWGETGVGFSLRYKCGDEHLGGIPFLESSDLDKIRDELAKHMSDFIGKLNPIIEKISKQFEEEKKNMEAINEWVRELETAKQIVLTGAPGTGKTYLARQIARSMVLSDEEEKLEEPEIKKLLAERVKFVQFHPSYDYTDFVEGLRPIQGVDGQVGFKRQDGAFKELCKAAIAAERRDVMDDFDAAWSRFIDDINGRYSANNPLELTTPKQDCTFKVFANRNGNLTFSTMSTGSSLTKDMVRKRYDDSSSVDHWGGYYDGVISHLQKTYGLKPRQRYVMIIDEINRGDISKIFGELFFAIDDGYRGPKGSIETQYQNLVEESDVFHEGFYVPKNVYIIGTMNDVDRNVESMDFAIRRRFTWEEIKPDKRFDAMMTGLKDSEGKEVPPEIIQQAKDRMANLNAAIRNPKNGLGTAYQIGPAYFRKIKDYTGDAGNRFKELWAHHLEPLLREYLRGMPNADDTIDKVFKPAYDLQTSAEQKEDPSSEQSAQ